MKKTYLIHQVIIFFMCQIICGFYINISEVNSNPILFLNTQKILDRSSERNIIGIWEGQKENGRSNITEPWGPIEITKNSDGTFSSIFLGSRLGDADRKLYETTINDKTLKIKWSKYGGPVLDAILSDKNELVGNLSHHGMVEHFMLKREVTKTNEAIIAQFEYGNQDVIPPSPRLSYELGSSE